MLKERGRMLPGTSASSRGDGGGGGRGIDGGCKDGEVGGGALEPRQRSGDKGGVHYRLLGAVEHARDDPGHGIPPFQRLTAHLIRTPPRLAAGNMVMQSRHAPARLDTAREAQVASLATTQPMLDAVHVKKEALVEPSMHEAPVIAVEHPEMPR